MRDAGRRRASPSRNCEVWGHAVGHGDDPQNFAPGGIGSIRGDVLHVRGVRLLPDQG